MRIHLISTVFLLFCCTVQCHNLKRSTSSISPVSLSMKHRKRQTRNKIEDFHTSNTITPFFLQPNPLKVASTRTDRHFQWWDSSGSPDMIQSGWYGFNRFSPRAARNLDNGSSRKARTAYLMGESSQIHPQANFKQASRHQTKQYDEDSAIFDILRELQRNIRPLPQRSSIEPRIIMIDDALPPGVLVPIRHPHFQPQHFNNNNHRYYNNNKHNNQRHYDKQQRHSNYGQRLASAPTPVTIKVVPLKITSIDIANALKSMTFLPFPLDFMQNSGQSDESNSDVMYDDKRSDEDESDLPPPSSHVAMPMDKGLGITYADTHQTEHFMGNYRPRK